MLRSARPHSSAADGHVVLLYGADVRIGRRVRIDEGMFDGCTDTDFTVDRTNLFPFPKLERANNRLIASGNRVLIIHCIKSSSSSSFSKQFVRLYNNNNHCRWLLRRRSDSN